MSRVIKPLHEQVLLVAGAMTPLGHEVVHQAVERGAKLFLVDNDEEALLARKVELEQNGYEVYFSAANLEDVLSLEQAVQNCLLSFGRIDTLLILFHRLNIDFVRDTLLPPMSESGGGMIINVVDEPLYYSLKHLDQHYPNHFRLVNCRRFKDIPRMASYLLRESAIRRTFSDGVGVKIEELAHLVLKTIRTFSA